MKRLVCKVVPAALAVLLGVHSASLGQEAAPATPSAPIPYETLNPPRPAPQRAVPRRPAPAAASAAATDAQASAEAAPLGVATLPPAELEAFVDGAVRSAMDRDHIAGVTVSVVQNGQVVLKKGYGYASFDPVRRVDPDRTLFRIGSISKTFTWILLMNEVEAGRIRLDAPINLYLPERVQVRDQGFREPVKVINLLDHTPGFEDRVLGQLMERSFDRERPLEVYLRQERPRRVREPGQFPTYSNYGVGLAGQALVYVTGQPFETLVEQRITGPLGMSRTTFREPHPPKAGIPAPMAPALAGSLSEPFRWSPATGFEARAFEYLGHLAPAGSASSTAADMATYMNLLLSNGVAGERRIFGPRAAQAFRTPLRQDASGTNGWAHGFAVYSLPGGHVGYGHSGATLSFMSNMVVAPELGLGVFVSANTESGGDLAMRLPGEIVQQFFAPGPPALRQGDPALARRADVYEGHFLGTRRAYVGLERFVGYVLSGRSVSVSRDGRLTTAGLNGVETWVPEGDPAAGRFVSTTGPERLIFEIRDGKARAFQLGSNDQRFQRVGLWSQPWFLGLLAALAVLAAGATLGGLALRNRRELRQTQTQSQASVVQTIQAVLWLLAVGLFISWVSGSGDSARVVYTWPGVRLILASACALVAALLTIVTIAALPAVWRGGRRLDSWSLQRKAAFTATTVIYAALAVVLFHWGALTPWSS
ncbi:serine hydrolase domain-containing protein [Phenylobacterium sp.]|uniref:serine hydrolase domain-containing protein n=1 Tax=Phenylobacterium sp. TaxID=1871053 RepID=UPI0019C004F0|nr:serine hydrolase domain-containing protein [Phenylobacterium sp.]MBC7166274.1 beta-lactamase family protein [Phenylobacterium sp.]